jgi:hypothetical protein
MTFCGLDNRGIVVRFPNRGKKLCILPQSVKKGPGTHPFYEFDKRGFFSAVKGPDNKSKQHLVLTKNEWSHTSTTPHPSCPKGTNLPLASPMEIEDKIKFFLRKNEFLNIWIEMNKDNVRPGSLY